MKHIFIVDDDIHIGNMLEEVLQRGATRSAAPTPALKRSSSYPLRLRISSFSI